MKAPLPEVYCRSCNRVIVVREELEFSYTEELVGEAISYHPKRDCDILKEKEAHESDY
jgi:hypothetical protein